MSIWRAPLLILGILLILLAAGALAAPWFIDFNRYKPQLEELGTRLAGRKVHIGGDVELVLFPWPMARLRDVRVAGGTEGRFRDLLRVEEVQARLSLPALFAARLEAEEVTLKRPVLALEHAGDGSGSWRLPGGGHVGLSLPAERIALDAIRIRDGRLLLADRRMRNTLEISRIDAQLRAPRVTGPWRMRGTVQLLGRLWRARFSTGTWQADKPLSMSLRLEPAQNRPGHVVRVDGEWHGHGNGASETPRFEGRLAVEPVIPQGRSDALDPIRQMELAAVISLTPDAVDLTDLKLTPRFPAASPFERVQGSARLEFGTVLGARVSLNTPKLVVNRVLERLLGAVDGVAAHDGGGNGDGLTVLRQHLLALARRLARLPPDMLLEVDVQAASVVVGGREMSGVSLSVEASSELLAIHHLRADAPGQGRLSFSGSLLAGDMLQLTGEVDVRSDDTRALLFAVSPAARKLLAEAWRGRAGRLKLLATVDLADYALRLVSRKLMLDDADMALDWRLHEPDKAGKGRQGSVRMRIGVLDADRYLRGRRGLMALAKAVRQWPAAGPDDLQLDMTARKLRLAGLAWQDVVLAMQWQPDRLQVKRVGVTDVAGVRVQGSGDFRRNAAGGWQGVLKLDARGGQAATLWQVVGRLTDVRQPPDWLQRMGSVDLSLRLDMQEVDDGGRRMDVVLNGHSGPLRLLLKAQGQGRQQTTDWQRLAWNVQAEVNSAQAMPLLALANVDVRLPDGAARLQARASGVPADGMKGELGIDLPGARLHLAGDVRLQKDASADDGGLLRAVQGTGQWTLALDDAAVWADVLRVAVPGAVALQGTGKVAFSPRRWQLSDLALQMADNRLAGRVVIDWTEAAAVEGVEAVAPKLTAELVATRLDPVAVLVMALGDAENPRRLRKRMAGGWDVDVVVRGDALELPRLGVVPGRARLTLQRTRGEPLRISLQAGRGDVMLHGTARLRRVELGLDVQGSLQARMPLERILRGAEGKVRGSGKGELELTFAGRPATLQGLLLALKGEGQLALEGLRMEGLAPERLFAVVRSIGTQAELDRFDVLARTSLMQGAVFVQHPVKGDVTLRDGLLEVKPLDVQVRGMRMRLSGLVDIMRQKLDVTLAFAMPDADGQPMFSVNLAGEAGALSVAPELDALREWAQQQVIRRKEEELKRLEERRRRLREQARRLEEKARQEEERRRRQQQLRQEAARLHEQLQQVLKDAYRQMQKGEEQKGEEKSGADVVNGQSSPRAVDNAAAAGSKLTIEALLRQLREDDQALPPVRHVLPDAAQAHPQGIAVAPMPKKRPARGRKEGLRQTTGKQAGRGAAVSRKAVQRASRARKKQTTRKESRERKAQTTRKAAAGKAATESAQSPRKAVQQGLVRPLVNWNRLAPAGREKQP